MKIDTSLQPGEFRVRGWGRFWQRLEDGLNGGQGASPEGEGEGFDSLRKPGRCPSGSIPVAADESETSSGDAA